MFDRIRNKTSGKKLCIFAVLFIIVFLPMNAYVSAFQRKAEITLMDFLFGGYDVDKAENILITLGASGRRIYLHLLPLDFGMGILYLLLLTNLIGWVEQRSGVKGRKPVFCFCYRFWACSRTGRKI